jgi:hypothetical protein
MKKVGSSNAPPTVASGSSHTAVGGIPMRRLGSSQSSRTPSALSIRPRDSPILRGDAGSPGKDSYHSWVSSICHFPPLADLPQRLHRRYLAVHQPTRSLNLERNSRRMPSEISLGASHDLQEPAPGLQHRLRLRLLQIRTRLSI